MLMRIGIGIPTPNQISPDFAIGNLPDILAYTGLNVKNIEMVVDYQKGVRTDRNRNEILVRMVEKNVDYMLWLDADMIYPIDIIAHYLEVIKDRDIDVMGCLYFRRQAPYDPVGYSFSGEIIHPYKPVPPQAIREGNIYEVDGVGFGGMMVNMKVYAKLGDDMWHNYGKNFHVPGEKEGGLTHDLEFCKKVREMGMSVKLHGSVKPLHIAEELVGYDDFMRLYNPIIKKHPSVVVMIPTAPKDEEQAKQTITLMKTRAGVEADFQILLDKDQEGYATMCNRFFKSTEYDKYVYAAADLYPAKNWLIEALTNNLKHDAGLTALNDGKWFGQLASTGMVDKRWAEDNYNGNLFYSGYFGHYNDTELTLIAKQQNRYSYAERAVILEIDHQKALGGKSVNKDDKKLFKKRKKKGFDGKVTDPNIINQFS